MTYVLIDSMRKIFSFDPYINSYYFADDFNEFQIELFVSLEDLNQDEGELDKYEETLKLYVSIAGTRLWLNLAS